MCLSTLSIEIAIPVFGIWTFLTPRECAISGYRCFKHTFIERKSLPRIFSFIFNRTPTRCYKQATKLVVNESIAGECGRPMKAHQTVTKGVTDKLSCPLKDFMNKLDSYNITSSIKWYRVSYEKILPLLNWDTGEEFCWVRSQFSLNNACAKMLSSIPYTLQNMVGMRYNICANQRLFISMLDGYPVVSAATFSTSSILVWN